MGSNCAGEYQVGSCHPARPWISHCHQGYPDEQTHTTGFDSGSVDKQSSWLCCATPQAFIFIFYFWIPIPFWFRTNSLEARITENLGTIHCLGCRACSWKDLGSRGWHLWVLEGYWALALCLCYSASGDQIYTSLRLLTATITGQYISCRTVQESEPEDIIVVSLSHTENG